MDEPVEIPQPFYLGVLGTHEQITKDQITDILLAILHVVERFPERMILPQEGKSSLFLQDWAERQSLPIQVYEADWYKHQKRALIFRDSRIMKEATHFLVFLNKRSEANEKTATRLAQQGHCVFTIAHSNLSIEQLIAEEETPKTPRSSGQSSSRRGARESKRGTGKAQGSPQSGTSELPESQCRLTDLWVT